ncbi:MAG: hypothetical protein CL927_12410, partial [Deltaproteobacteria bacterium]|nr:hypothetical protein [Deltaproteobacteria bacterium]
MTDSTDCDDGSRAVNPAATEVCNSIDDDCDRQIDDADASVDTSTGSTFYRDGDADTYGDASSTTRACSLPSGYVTDSSDCDDGTRAVNPAATEVCNSIDDDCDSLVDDADSSLDASTGSTFYRDSDVDTYGDASNTIQACGAPGGYVTDASDCDDSDGSVSPAATEICFDGLDNDCSGSEDDSSACYVVDFNSDASDVNHWEEAGFPSAAVTMYVTVASGVVIDSTDPSIPALTTDGFASGSTIYIENLGTIHGRGGDGACSSSGDGEDGGDAIEVTVDVELDTSVGGVYGGGGGSGDDPTGGGGAG